MQRDPKRDEARRARHAAKALSGMTGPEDGVDPRDDAKARARQHRPERPRLRGPSHPPGEAPAGRKALQLARQVAEAVDALLGGEAADPVLGGLRVASVVPAPDASRMLVTVAPAVAVDGFDPRDALERLARADGWLRAGVAASVTRKHVPTLAFRVDAGPAAQAR